VSKALVLALLVLAGAARAAEPALHDPTEPFRPSASGVASGRAPAPRFRLTAVLISPTRRVAIVNGKPLQEGQSVAGAEIVKIDARSVQLRDGTRDFVVQLGNSREGAPERKETLADEP
jgi:hypothetical protein